MKPSTKRLAHRAAPEKTLTPVSGGKSVLKNRPSRRGWKEGTKVIFREMMAEKFLKLMKDLNSHIQEAQ